MRTIKLMKRPAPRYVHLFRNISYVLSVVSSTVASIVVALGVTILLYFRDGLAKGYFTGMGTIVTLCGLLLSLFAALHFYSILPDTNLQPLIAKKLMFMLLEMTLFVAFIYEIYVAYYVWIIYSDLVVMRDINSSGRLTSSAELNLAHIFNSLYFQAIQTCGSNSFWLWEWVDDKCDSEMSKTSCQHCGNDYPFCVVDGQLCSTFSDEHPSCPYHLCRKPIILFICHKILLSFLIVICVSAVTHCLHIIANVPLMYYEFRRRAIVPVKVKVVSRITTPVATNEILEVATDASNSFYDHPALLL